MRKIKVEFKLLLCFALMIISALFVGLNVNHVSINAFATSPEQEQNLVAAQTSFDDFANAVMRMTEQYAADENAIVFFDKENDLSIDENGNYWVNERTFNQLTGREPRRLQKLAKSVTVAPTDTNQQLDELATQAGYNFTVDELSVVLTRKFGTKRLMILSENRNLDLRGAVSAISYGNIYVCQYETELAASEAYEFYQNCPDVQAVDVDGFCWADSASEFVTIDTEAGLNYKSWGASHMGVQEFSQYLLDTAEDNDSKLPEVVVAVLDTGIDTDHPWFNNRFLLDENGKIIGKNFSSSSSITEYDFEDDQGHGTHCAGIICDLTLPNVKILPIKFMYYDASKGKATGSNLDAYLGLIYTINQKQNFNIVAINMSFGSESNSLEKPFFQKAINDAYNTGIFSVVSAGNEHKDAYNYSPANITNAITVSALKPVYGESIAYDESYSNYGEVIDVCAPGSGIESANFKYKNELYRSESGYTNPTVLMSGTSMAAPHVAAYIALLYSDYLYPYTQNEINQILNGENNDYLVDLGALGKDIYYGNGMPTLTNAIPDSNYTVNYHLESLYDLNSSAPHDYDVQGEVLSGKIDTLTAAVPKTFPGFKLVGEVEQKTVVPHGKTTIDIYYQRNKYLVTVNISDSDEGLISVTGDGEYLYGANVELSPLLSMGYYLHDWELLACDDTEFAENINQNAAVQKFEMPASNLTFTAHSEMCSYDIIVNIIGSGTVSEEKVTVYYGEGMTFKFKAEDGYYLNSVTCNGVIKDFTEIDDQTYRLNLSEITDDIYVSANFVKENSPADSFKVWLSQGGGVIISASVFCVIFVALVIIFRVKKH